MQPVAIALSLALITVSAPARAAVDCTSLTAPQAPAGQVLLAPVAAELLLPSHRLGAPVGMRAHSFDPSMSLEQVLYRQQLATCVTQAPEPAAYQKRTEFDNAPWRFDMNQNGKRMTADDFTAWMEAKGVRVVSRAPDAATPTVDGSATEAGAGSTTDP